MKLPINAVLLIDVTVFGTSPSIVANLITRDGSGLLYSNSQTFALQAAPVAQTLRIPLSNVELAGYRLTTTGGTVGSQVIAVVSLAYNDGSADVKVSSLSGGAVDAAGTHGWNEQQGLRDPLVNWPIFRFFGTSPGAGLPFTFQPNICDADIIAVRFAYITSAVVATRTARVDHATNAGAVIFRNWVSPQFAASLAAEVNMSNTGTDRIIGTTLVNTTWAGCRLNAGDKLFITASNLDPGDNFNSISMQLRLLPQSF